MIDRTKVYRVENRCKYDIGVRLVNGTFRNVEAGSFMPLTVDDIMFIEGLCKKKKYFTQRYLVPVDEYGKDVPMDQLGLVKAKNAVAHLDEAEISAALKQSPAKIEKWLDQFSDPVELDEICEIAKSLDLPMNKVKVLKAKCPNKDWLGQDDEQ